MEKFEVPSTIDAETKADARTSKTPLSLRLDKRVIRTLTGQELRLVGGGSVPVTWTCFCPTR